MENQPTKLRCLRAQTHERGLEIEKVALQYLLSNGYFLIVTNFRWQGGELDLIVEDPTKAIIFVEVRSSWNSSPYLAFSITAKKRRRLRNSTHVFFLKYPRLRNRPHRFDLIWVQGTKIEHWKNVEI